MLQRHRDATAEALGIADAATHAPKLKAAARSPFSRVRAWMSTLPPDRQCLGRLPGLPRGSRAGLRWEAPPFPTMMRPRAGPPMPAQASTYAYAPAHLVYRLGSAYAE
eukprot:903869-Alexandrium_andersonii.AAC.1